MSRHSNLNTSDHHQIFKEIFFFFFSFSQRTFESVTIEIFIYIFLQSFLKFSALAPTLKTTCVMLKFMTWHDEFPTLTSFSQRGKTRKCCMQIAVFTHHWTTSIKQTEHNKEPGSPKLWEVWSPHMGWSIPAASKKKAVCENICVYIYFRNTFTLYIVHVRKWEHWPLEWD